MNLVDYMPAIKAGRIFLKEVNHEEFSPTMDQLIIAQNPLWDMDDDMYFPHADFLTKVVVPHKVAVFRAGMELWDKGLVRFGRTTEENAKRLWVERLLRHDLSKFGKRENGYIHKMKGMNSGMLTLSGFSSFHDAWGAHQGSNSHHPESCYRVSRSGELLEVHQMLFEDILEMVADWIGASRSYGNGDWLGYLNHKNEQGETNLEQWRWHTKTLEGLKAVLSKLDIYFAWEWVGKDRIKVLNLALKEYLNG